MQTSLTDVRETSPEGTAVRETPPEGTAVREDNIKVMVSDVTATPPEVPRLRSDSKGLDDRERPRLLKQEAIKEGGPKLLKQEAIKEVGPRWLKQEAIKEDHTIGPRLLKQDAVKEDHADVDVAVVFTLELPKKDEKQSEEEEQVSASAKFEVKGGSKPKETNMDTSSVETATEITEPKSEDTSAVTPRKLTSVTDENDDCSSKTPQPPHSPIIRSRYARRLRSDNKSSQIYADARMWKATPPKRMIRHRKASTERRPDISDLNLEMSSSTGLLSVDTVRERSKSDSYFMKKESQSVSVNSLDSSNFRERYRLRQQREQRSIQDIISRYEQQNLIPPKCPPSPSMKPTLSPVRKLKTAQELLQDSEQKWTSKHMSRSSSTPRAERVTLPREKAQSISSTSSDKENSESKVQRIVRQLSRENTPERSLQNSPRAGPQGETVRLALCKLSTPSPDSIRSKPPLKDLTNESKIQQITQTLRGSQSPDRALSSSQKKISELPRDGTVIMCTEMFENNSSCTRRASTGSLNTQDIMLKIKPDSTITLDGDSPSASKQRVSRKDSSNTETSSLKSKSSPGSPVRGPSSPSSPSGRERKFHKLFTRKLHFPSPSPSSQSSPQKSGAISRLCKQALTVNVQEGDGEVAGTATGTDAEGSRKRDVSADRRKGVGKLLDANWLQRPRKFFKVSK